MTGSLLNIVAQNLVRGSKAERLGGICLSVTVSGRIRLRDPVGRLVVWHEVEDSCALRAAEESWVPLYGQPWDLGKCVWSVEIAVQV